MKKLKILKYNDATVGRLRNKRIIVETDADHDIRILFTMRTNLINPKSFHEVIKNKIVNTGIILTYEGAFALYELLHIELNK